MLIQAGVYPHSIGTPLDVEGDAHRPLSAEYLVERMFVEYNSRSLGPRQQFRDGMLPSDEQNLPLQYVGPRTLVRFVDCLGKIFQEKSTEVAAERMTLR